MGGDAPAPTASETTAQRMAAFIGQFPDYLNVQLDQLEPFLTRVNTATANTAPASAQTNLDLYSEFGPQFNQIGNEIARDNAMSQAASDRDVVAGPGRELTQEAYQTAQIFDKPWFDAREQAAAQIANLLGSVDVNRLTGSEREEISRGLARENESRGTRLAPSAIETLGAANQFGSALQGKRDALGKALESANQFLSTAKSGTDTFQVATGKPSAANTGENRFSNASESANTSELFNQSRGFMGDIAGLQSDEMNINANRRDSLDRFNQSFSSIVGSL